MQRKRYDTNFDGIQEQALQRAKAGMHPAVVQARERPSPIEQQTGGVQAPAESALQQQALGQREASALQQMIANRPSNGILGGRQSPNQTAQASEPQRGMRQMVLEQMKQRYGQEGAMAQKSQITGPDHTFLIPREADIRRFQEFHHLPVTGVIDTATQRKMKAVNTVVAPGALGYGGRT